MPPQSPRHERRRCDKDKRRCGENRPGERPMQSRTPSRREIETESGDILVRLPPDDNTADIAGLREQVLANAVALFPQVVYNVRQNTPGRYTPPVSEIFNISVIPLIEDLAFRGFQARLAFKRADESGHSTIVVGGKENISVRDALQSMLVAVGDMLYRRLHILLKPREDLVAWGEFDVDWGLFQGTG